MAQAVVATVGAATAEVALGAVTVGKSGGVGGGGDCGGTGGALGGGGEEGDGGG